MSITIKCPRCTGRVFLQPFITDQGLIGGYEAKCLNCGRDWTDAIHRTRQTTAA